MENSDSVHLCERILPKHGINLIAELKDYHRTFAELFKIHRLGRELQNLSVLGIFSERQRKGYRSLKILKA